MKRAMAVAAMALALAGCRSAGSLEAHQSTPEEAQARLRSLLQGQTVTCEMKGASLEVVLSQIAEQTGASFALDPRLCFTHGPATFSAKSQRLDDTIEQLRRECPELQIELWRGVVFVTKAGEPLLVPQTPILSAPEDDLLMKVNVTFVHTPLEEVCSSVGQVGYRTMGFVYGGSWPSSHTWWQTTWRVDPSIADRRVTATFHDVPLISVLEVVSRLADCKVVWRGDANVFEPREPVPPAEQERRKS
jgi:hypothetical protein